LDEFQDTSNIQWDNFRPLLKESDSNNHYNLIVGDVKQSIYRWRGSDWNLLDSELKKQFPGAKESCLDSNFRSLGNIVEFNNGFFKFAADCLDSLDKADMSGKSISGMYMDVGQKVAVHDSSQGSVDLTFCSSENQNTEILGSIRNVMNSGGRYGDIAVLVRTNRIGSDIAEFLLAEKIPVISDDSLKVKSSITVRRLVSLLAYFNDENDSINAYLAESLGISKPESCHSLIDLCEILLRDLAKNDETLFSGEIPYIQAFMDDLMAWSSVNGNSSGDFLKYWETADPKLGSPKGVDAVRIITIHKSKGLSFPYVIFPHAEKVKLFTPESRWCHPDLSGTSLQGAAEGIYLVKLSSDKLQTVFADDYLEDRRKQLIDNLNTFYVASTRAAKGMRIIASTPSAKCMDGCRNSSAVMYPFTDMSQILYWYAEIKGADAGFVKEKEEAETDESEGRLNYIKGDVYDFSSLHGSDQNLLAEDTVISEYPSYPINPDYIDDKSGLMKKRVRLDFSSDSYDFFSDDGKTGIEASVRLRGIVMHNILSKVKSPSDLDKAVDEVFESGDIDENEMNEIISFLRGRIQSVAEYGWFPEIPAEVENEISLIDADGRIYRPDRVILHPDGSVAVVDYKFGARNEKYLFQIGKYADIYKRMGYDNVKAYLWYVPAGEIINASDLF
jgi:ATP-dependent exoDNAse (exonuclease V) beta subunit